VAVGFSCFLYRQVIGLSDVLIEKERVRDEPGLVFLKSSKRDRWGNDIREKEVSI
jgi:hypothetical protein